MKSMKLKMVTLAVMLLSITSCSQFETFDVENPNNAAINSVASNATRSQINQLGVGLQSSARIGFYNYCLFSGSIGREVVVLANTESRFYIDILGGAPLDGAAFYNAYWTELFSVRKAGQVIMEAAANTNSITSTERNALNGFAKTIQAFVMLNALNMQGENGIRIDLNDPFNPGPFVSYNESLAFIRGLLNSAAADLANGGNAFPFTMTSGYTGFTTPATFRQVNRALAARAAVYAQDWNGALAALNESFFNLNGNLTTGPRFTYSTTSPDFANPFFQNANSNISTLVVTQQNFVPEAENGDARLAKVGLRNNPRTLGGITGTHEPRLFATNTSPLTWIKNEELILINAEANIRLGAGNFPAAIASLDRIRTANNLAPYSGPVTESALIDEMLKQRRYSLFFEGHRWVDMRRYNRLNQLPLDRPNHRVYDRFVRPASEILFDQNRR